jgi:hypothetical protein
MPIIGPHQCRLLVLASADYWSPPVPTLGPHQCHLLVITSADSWSPPVPTLDHHQCHLLFLTSADSWSPPVPTLDHHQCADSWSSSVPRLLVITSASSWFSAVPTLGPHQCQQQRQIFIGFPERSIIDYRLYRRSKCYQCHRAQSRKPHQKSCQYMKRNIRKPSGCDVQSVQIICLIQC